MKENGDRFKPDWKDILIALGAILVLLSFALAHFAAREPAAPVGPETEARNVQPAVPTPDGEGEEGGGGETAETAATADPAIAPASNAAEGKRIVVQIGNPMMEVDGVEKEIDPGRDTVPLIQEGRTLLPIRTLVESMGGTVSWVAEEKGIVLDARGTSIEMWLDRNEIRVDGVQGKTDVAPLSVNGRTMVPVRFVAENFRCEVVWDSDTKKVTLEY
ncbi:stalk domain-containing protein [Anaerotalea alkaliphila]|uniref:Copper amine oxidase N-terminal domain-containing protein n=1 Tax=Anaerotalea alkaliphila TaxID=2662126 RepID=A0A7X5HV65_9FIRM|nr:stalk domain-containing protein [Anaerotalea alkaliphila]NDL67237.1 copper amine oxidase N-terminal domain-containing protein [Anaerotalea alkaliphila]